MTRPITQHDVFSNPTRQTRATYPLLVVLQSDYVEGESRVVAPLRLREHAPTPPVNRAVPIVTVDGRQYALALPQIASIDTSRLRARVGSIAAFHDDITRALDWLFFGL
jgi:toxin CcdB